MCVSGIGVVDGGIDSGTAVVLEGGGLFPTVTLTPGVKAIKDGFRVGVGVGVGATSEGAVAATEET